MMTLDDLLDRCRRRVANGTTDDDALTMAIAVIELLGVAHPCGYDDFGTVDGQVDARDLGRLTIEDARGLASSLLRAADAADAQEST